jgi:flagellar protein FlaJ
MRNLFENKKLARFANFLRPLSRFFIILSPNLGVELQQADYRVKQLSFASISLLLALSFSVFLELVLLLVLYSFNAFLTQNVILVSLIVLVFFVFTLFNLLKMPRIYLIRKGRELDTSLLFALRHMLVKVKSGIPFFDSIVGVAYGNYGAVSSEFRKYVKDVEGGTNEIVALERLSFYNPSSFLRRFIWQMTNSLRAGTDIAKTLEVLVDGLESERYVQVKAFGGRLSPIALMYIMFTIILPALGTTFLTVFASFLGAKISNEFFYVIPILIVLTNFFFMNIIKSTRPVFEMT